MQSPATAHSPLAHAARGHWQSALAGASECTLCLVWMRCRCMVCRAVCGPLAQWYAQTRLHGNVCLVLYHCEKTWWCRECCCQNDRPWVERIGFLHLPLVWYIPSKNVVKSRRHNMRLHQSFRNMAKKQAPSKQW